MSSSVHKRSDVRPEGDTTNRKVRMSNRLVSNTVVLLQWAHSRGVYWVVEQPATSRMWKWGPMEALLAECFAVRVHTYMGCFGHRQQKPTVLWGTLPTLAELGRARRDVPESARGTDDPAVVGYKRDASGRVCGNRFLHESATYTAGFGAALFGAWARSVESTPAPADAPVGPVPPALAGRGRGSAHGLAAAAAAAASASSSQRAPRQALSSATTTSMCPE